MASVNKSAVIGVSSVLPKPCETTYQNDRIIALNREVKRLCSENKVHFIPSYRPFVDKDRYHRVLCQGQVTPEF